MLRAEDVERIYGRLLNDLAEGVIVHAVWFDGNGDIVSSFRAARLAIRKNETAGDGFPDLVAWNPEGKERILNSADVFLRHTKKKDILPLMDAGALDTNVFLEGGVFYEAAAQYE
jgi:hypothetical protein